MLAKMNLLIFFKTKDSFKYNINASGDDLTVEDQTFSLFCIIL